MPQLQGEKLRALRGAGDIGREGRTALSALAAQSSSLVQLSATARVMDALDTRQSQIVQLVHNADPLTQVHLHRNTVRHRTRRIEELTGRDLAHTVDAAELHVALECARIRGLG
jgi:sugar diacid utilization regulator